MKYKNLSTDLKILSWFSNNPSQLNVISEDRYHILEWICFGYRGKESNKNLLITKLISSGADIDNVNQNCFSYIFNNFLLIKKQPLGTNIVLNKILYSKQLNHFYTNTELLKFYTNSYKNDDFSEIKYSLILKANTKEIFQKIIQGFLSTNLSNKQVVDFYENILLFSKTNQNFLFSEIFINSKSFLTILKEKSPTVNSCGDLLAQIETIENYKKLNSQLSINNEPKKITIKI